MCMQVGEEVQWSFVKRGRERNLYQRYGLCQSPLSAYSGKCVNQGVERPNAVKLCNPTPEMQFCETTKASDIEYGAISQFQLVFDSIFENLRLD